MRFMVDMAFNGQMHNVIKGFPAGLQPMVWRSCIRTKGLAANQAAIPAPSAVLGLHESVAGNVAASCFSDRQQPVYGQQRPGIPCASCGPSKDFIA
jgi:hypothetical protein